MSVWTEMAAIWLADAIEGDCDMEPEPETVDRAACPTILADDEDMEDEGAPPGFLHRNGAWMGRAA